MLANSVSYFPVNSSSSTHYVRLEALAQRRFCFFERSRTRRSHAAAAASFYARTEEVNDRRLSISLHLCLR